MIERLILAFLNLLVASLHLLLDDSVVCLLILIVGLVMISLLVVPAPVSQREHIVTQLQNEEREIQVAHIKVNVLQLLNVRGWWRHGLVIMLLLLLIIVIVIFLEIHFSPRIIVFFKFALHF